MRVAVNKKHLSLNEMLAQQSNLQLKRFTSKNYSNTGDISHLLMKKDISIEKKKKIFIKKLHDSIIEAFSVSNAKFSKKTFDVLKVRVYVLRKLINKLRSINYYLQTLFLQELRNPKIAVGRSDSRPKQVDALAHNDLEILEYTAYKLIEKAIMLDKNLLSEYSKKRMIIAVKEKLAINDLEKILRKETAILEHLEAKLPPANALTKDLVRQPKYTHWVARVFALLSYLGHLYYQEASIFNNLKMKKKAKIIIDRKITQMIGENSKLIAILQEKSKSMNKLRIDSMLRREIHNLSTIITL